MSQNSIIGTLFNRTPSLKRWSIIFLAWTLIAILFAAQASLELAHIETPSNDMLGFAFRFEGFEFLLPVMLRSYTWALFTPLIFKLAENFPIEPPKFWLHLLSLTGIGLLITFVTFVIIGVVLQWSGVNSSSLGINIAFLPHFLTFWAILGVGYLLHYQLQSQEQELKTAQLETKLAQIQLQVLRSQLNPHFLFNILHAISATMYRNVDAADRMLVRLSELLRLSLEEIDGQFSTIQKEFDFLNLYLELEQIRFQDRLSVSINAPAEVLTAQVPTMLLQPLVENAVRHGISPQATLGEIKITALHSNGQLVLEILDNGTGLPDKFTEGLGLTNTRSRLHQLYPDNCQFELHNRPEGGLSVQISLPFTIRKENQNGN